MSALIQTESPELTDADVVQRAQRGDADAFERVYRLHSRKIYNLCLRMVGNPTEAEDLTQDVFLRGLFQVFTLRDIVFRNPPNRFISRHQERVDFREWRDVLAAF